MAHGDERRRDPRVPLVLRVDHLGAPEALRDVTENLSAGGLFLRTDRDLRPNERLRLQIGFPGLLDPVEVEVVVVRHRAAGPTGPAGVAVTIPPDRAEDRRKLARLAESSRPSADDARRAFRILVVEDNPHVVEMYEYALRKLGGDAATVSVEYSVNGHDALVRLAAAPRIDLVMADLYMPVLDGFTLVERMRGDPGTSAIPIVVISAGADDARTRALELGVDVYLQKPVQFSDIITTVRALLRLKG